MTPEKPEIGPPISGCLLKVGRLYYRVRGPLAQLAEQQTLNLWVLGSIPRRLTTPRLHPDLLARDQDLFPKAEPTCPDRSTPKEEFAAVRP